MVINIVAFFQRVLDLLVAPRRTWRAIKGEPDRGLRLCTGYAFFLAGLPVLAGLLGALAAEEGRGAGIVQVVLEFGAVALGLFGAGLLLNLLTLCGTDWALKLVAYASTPLWLAGLVGIVRELMPFALLGFIGVVLELAIGVEEALGIAPARARRIGLVVGGAWFAFASVGIWLGARALDALFAPSAVGQIVPPLIPG